MNKRRRWKAKRRRAAVKASWDWVSTFKTLKAGDVFTISGRYIVLPSATGRTIATSGWHA